MTSKIIFTLVITITAMISLTTTSRPPYIQCQSSEECPPGSCCTLQPTRYSFPQCSPMIQEEQVCKPTNSIINTTLGYPDGNQVKIWNVYYIMCPCAPGLVCDRRSNGVCKGVSINEV